MFSDELIQRALALADDPRVLDKPTAGELRIVLDECFRASLRVEEGRRTRFHLAFVEPIGPGRPPGECLGWTALRFRKSLPFSASELVKLAQAIDLRQAFLGVRRAQSEAVTGLRIWGVLVVGLSLWNLRYARATRAVAMGPEYLSVIVNGPAQYEIRGPKGVLALTGDDPETSLDPDLDAMGVVELLRIAPSSQTADVMPPEWPVLWGRSISVVLQHIRESGHGGALFLVDADSPPPVLEVKYRVEPVSAFLRNALAEMHRAEILVDPATDAVVRAQGSVESLDLARATAELKSHEWLSAAAWLAQLASVDGGVLISRDLCLLGFGSVVRDIDSCKARAFALRRASRGTTATQYDLSKRGTRHRSAAAFCVDTPGAAAFVVSQDGHDLDRQGRGSLPRPVEPGRRGGCVN